MGKDWRLKWPNFFLIMIIWKTVLNFVSGNSFILRSSLRFIGIHNIELGNVISNKKNAEQPSAQKKKSNKAKSLHKAQLATSKEGVLTSYKSSVFGERKTKAAEEIATEDSWSRFVLSKDWWFTQVSSFQICFGNLPT